MLAYHDWLTREGTPCHGGSFHDGNLSPQPLHVSRTHHRTIHPNRCRRRQALDRILGSLGSRRERHLHEPVQRMGRQGEGRNLHRLHHQPGQEGPADHRGRGSGQVRPRCAPDADLVAPRLFRTDRTGERHHGAADQAERRGQRNRAVSRRQVARVPSTRGSQIKGPCSRIDLMKKFAGIDVQ
jgi:hypothetical protein